MNDSILLDASEVGPYKRLINSLALGIIVPGIVLSIWVVWYWLSTEKNRKKRTLTMVACVALSDIFWQGAELIDHSIGMVDSQWPRDTPGCQILAFVMFYFCIFNWVWVIAMCIDLIYILFFSLNKKKRIPLRYFAIISIFVPLILDCIFIGIGVFGPNVILCYWRPNLKIIGIIFTFLCLISSAHIIMGYVIIALRMYYLSQSSNFESERYKKLVRKITLYPLIYIFCWTMPPAYNIYELLYGSLNPNLALVVIVLTASNGLLNCLAYFFLRVYDSKSVTKSTKILQPTVDVKSSPSV